jgi:hypothetical protein
VHEQRAKDAANPTDAKNNLREAQGLYMRALSMAPPQPLEAYAHAGLANAAYFLEDYATAAREWAIAYPNVTEPDAKAWVAYRAGVERAAARQLRRGRPALRRGAEAVPRQRAGPPRRHAPRRQGVSTCRSGPSRLAANAQNAVAKLKAQGFSPVRSADAQGRQIIGVGPIPSYAQAKALRDRLSGQYPGAAIVP